MDLNPEIRRPAATAQGTASARIGFGSGMRFGGGAGLALLLTLCLMPGAGAATEPMPLRCVYAASPDAVVTLAGKLTLQPFAGPPNFESIESGDAETHVLILELPRDICFEDGEFADGSERFNRVHIHADDAKLAETLRSAIGREISVVGKAVGAHTAHHRAPMVVFVQSVTIG